MREELRGRSDHVGGFRLDAIFSDALKLRRHDEVAARRQCACEVYQAGFVDPERVHAMHHHNSGRGSDTNRPIDAGGNSLAIDFE